MAKKILKIPISLSTLILACFVCTACIYFILDGHHFFQGLQSVPLKLATATSLGLAVTTSFYTSFHRGLFLKIFNPFQDERSLIAEAALINFVTLLLLHEKVIPPWSAFHGFVLTAALVSYKLTVLGLYETALSDKTRGRISLIISATMLIVGICLWPTRNFWPLQSLMSSIAIFQTLLHIVCFSGVLFWMQKKSSSHLIVQNTDRESQSSTRGLWMTLAICLINILAQVFTDQCLNLYKLDQHQWLIATAQFLFLPALLDSWIRLDSAGSDRAVMIALSRFTSGSARRLFERYQKKSSQWAATVGQRTSIFTIDHSPQTDAMSNIPASIVTLRNEEISAIVNRLVRQQSSSISTDGQKIVGIFDPEATARPCVDALNLFSILYLDAGALVERRLVSFFSLLPIVNPGLEKVISLEKIMPLLRKSNWFYYIDYTWIDENIVNSTKNSRYGIHVDPIAEEMRQAIILKAKTIQGSSNHLWISAAVQDRLLHESPAVSSILEMHQISLPGKPEHMMFSAKFEQLIPRLQRYYAMDEMRRRIVDYEMSGDALRLTKILTIQIENTRSLQDFFNILESIASYPWSGFKEKDHALKLILRIHEHSLQRKDFTASQLQDLQSALQNTAALVGYPNQLLNQAQLQKLELRRLNHLEKHALDPSSFRFAEAWNLIGNFDYKKFDSKDLQTIRTLLHQAVQEQDILHSASAAAKIIDATVAMIRCQDHVEAMKDLDIVFSLMDRFIDLKGSSEVLTLAVDAVAFLSEFKSQWVSCSPTLLKKMSYHVDHLPEQEAIVGQCLRNRWHEYLSRLNQMAKAS